MFAACIIALIPVHYYRDNSISHINPCMITNLNVVQPKDSYYDAKCQVVFPGRYNFVQTKETCDQIVDEIRKIKP